MSGNGWDGIHREPYKQPGNGWFKRFLAWVVMVVITTIFLNVVDYGIVFVQRIFKSIAQLNEGLYWLSIIMTWSGIVAVFTGIAIWGNVLMYKLSESVCQSRNGTRYIVFGTALLVLYAVDFYLIYAGAIRNSSIAAMITSILYVIALLITSNVLRKR